MTDCSCDDPTEREWPRGTVEYLEGTVTVDVVLDVQPVKVTFDRVTLIDAEWTEPGEWLDDDHTQYRRRWRTSSVLTDDDFPDGAYTVEVFVQLVDSDETPFVPAGSIILT